MKSIRKMAGLALVGIVALMFAPRAEATSIVVTPHSQTVIAGSPFVVDIDVTGVAAISPLLVGGASFNLAFDDTILTGQSFTLDPDGVMSNLANPIIDGGSGFGPGGASAFSAFFIASYDALSLPAQPDTFRLATLTFLGKTPGFSNLTLQFVPVGAPLSDQNGIDLPAIAVNGCVLVTPQEVPSVVNNVDAVAVDPCPNAAAVPEPATFGLLAGGLAMLARRRRKPQA
jgi:hypothetical protein